MKKVFASFVLTMMLATVAAAAPNPTEQLQAGVGKILSLLNDKSLDPDVRNSEIEEIVRDHFDFDVMAQWILGIHWRKASPQERERFINLFTDLLEANYKGRIGEYAEQYDDERIDYVGERIIEDRALIDTFVVTKNKKIPISYKMILQGDEWKIYDVVIEEVSLVRNFRNTYDEIVRKEGLSGLFARMEQKITDLRSGKIPPAEANGGAQ
ncbi:MAG: ABC transporter substrate-binding protein [Desulfuromonadales bacterium]